MVYGWVWDLLCQLVICWSLFASKLVMGMVQWGWFKSSSGCLTDDSRTVLLLWMLFVICVWLSHTAMSVSCSLVVTCWERADPWLSCM